MAQFTGNGSINGSFRIILDVWENSVDTNNNKSNVGWRVSLQSTASYNFAIIGSTVVVNIGGNQVYNAYSQKTLGPYSTITVAEGNLDIWHDNDGSKTIYCEASYTQTSGASYTPGNMSCWGNYTLTKINRYAKITSANNFTDEENPKVYFNNPANYWLTFKLEAGGNDHLIVRENVQNPGSPYTFILTDEERQTLRELSKNSNTLTVRYTIGTSINSSIANWDYADRTMTIINANPIFSNFTYEDVDTKTLSLTGNSQTLIKGYSDVKATISVANKATPQKEALMSRYKLQMGEKQVEVNYSDSADVSLTLQDPLASTISLYAIDSRGNSTLKQISPTTWINYTTLHENGLTMSAERSDGGVSQEVTMTIDGKFWNGNFGQVDNHIKSATYRFRRTNFPTWTDGETELVITELGGQYTFEGLIKGDLDALGFSMDYNFEIEVTIQDELSTATYTFVLQSATPQMAIHRNGVSFGTPYNTTSGGNIQIKGVNIFDAIFPVGSIFVTTVDMNPSNFLNGTWVATETATSEEIYMWKRTD